MVNKKEKARKNYVNGIHKHKITKKAWYFNTYI